MNSYIQRFRFAATGRWAVSLRTYLLIFPFGYLVTTERELIFNSVSLSRAALIALAGELSSFLYLFITQGLILGNRKNELQPLWKCFFVWISTGMVRGIGVAAYANWAFGYQWDLIRRVPAATGYTTVVMALAALYFGSIDRRRTEFRALQSLSHILTQEEKGLLQESSRNRIQAEAVLQNVLLPQVKSLQNGIEKELQSSNTNSPDLALQNLYQQSLRIAAELEDQRKLMAVDSDLKSTQSESSGIRSYWATFFPQIMSVRITVIFFSLGAISGQLSRNGLIGVAAGLLGLIPLLLIIVPISQLIKRKRDQKVALFIFGFSGTYAISYLYNVLQPSLGFDLTHPYAPWYSAAKTLYGLYFASVIGSLLVDSGQKRDHATEYGIQAKENVEKLVARNHALLNAALVGQYGTLQGKITGVTMALHLMGSHNMESISRGRKIELLENANQLLGETLIEIEKLSVVPQ